MRQRIDLDDLWRLARQPSILSYKGMKLISDLPEASVLLLDDLLGKHIDTPALVERLREATVHKG